MMTDQKNDMEHMQDATANESLNGCWQFIEQKGTRNVN